MNFIQLAEKVLEFTKQPMTVNEIWEKATELGWDERVGSQGKTPWQSIGARIYLDIRDNPATIFILSTKRPSRFGLKTFTPDVEISPENRSQPKKMDESYHERDLHPLLVKFADSYFHFRGAKLKTIFHENSSRQKKGYNKWIHPDLVGVYFSFNDKIREYEKVIIEFQNDFSISATKVFSFEVKKKIELHNLREFYFQAVSNSSWANEGYLVALNFDDEVVEEVRRLAHSFGIGLIKLNPENIDESQIVVPAAYRKELDLDAMDRLAGENRDFALFLQSIIDDNKIKKSNSRYDNVLDDGEMAKYLRDKGMVK